MLLGLGRLLSVHKAALLEPVLSGSHRIALLARMLGVATVESSLLVPMFPEHSLCWPRINLRYEWSENEFCLCYFTGIKRIVDLFDLEALGTFQVGSFNMIAMELFLKKLMLVLSLLPLMFVILSLLLGLLTLFRRLLLLRLLAALSFNGGQSLLLLILQHHLLEEVHFRGVDVLDVYVVH